MLGISTSPYVYNKTCKEIHPGVPLFSRVKGLREIPSKHSWMCNFLQQEVSISSSTGIDDIIPQISIGHMQETNPVFGAYNFGGGGWGERCLSSLHDGL